MNIKIYINERPVEDYTQDELNEIKVKLTETAMAAAGFKKNEVLHETRGKGSARSTGRAGKKDRQGAYRQENAAAGGGYEQVKGESYGIL